MTQRVSTAQGAARFPTPEPGPGAGAPRTGGEGVFHDELVRPFLTVAAVALGIVEWPTGHVEFPAVAMALFVVAALGALILQLPRRGVLGRLGEPVTVGVASIAMLSGCAVAPLARCLGVGSLPFLIAVAVGAKVRSRAVAGVVVVAGGVLDAAVTAWAASPPTDPTAAHWWLALVVCLPVYIGIAQRNRHEAVASARDAALQARRASESEAREAALLERNRIGQEIHDLLGHSLSGIKLQLDLADALIEHQQLGDATKAVDRAREIAVTGIADTRRAVHALRKTDEPIGDALERLARHSLCPIEIVGSAGALEPGTIHAMIRTAQEALTNADKHAPGAPRWMRLVLADERVTLTVTNGRATAEADPDLAGGTGVGLAGMRERARELGGRLHASSTPDGGWTVELELPR